MAFSVSTPKKSDIVKTVEDEKFVQIYTPDEKAVQLADNKRSIMNVKPWISACALGIHSYSSGIYRIRTRVDKWLPLLGIRSRNIPPVPKAIAADSYMLTNSTYGWAGFGRYLDGNSFVNHWNHDSRVGHVWTITLNCNEHRLHIIDENTTEEDEMKVDVSKAPLPWCLFIGLPRMTAGISLI